MGDACVAVGGEGSQRAEHFHPYAQARWDVGGETLAQNREACRSREPDSFPAYASTVAGRRSILIPSHSRYAAPTTVSTVITV
jgi:hypothetical protein